MKKRVFILVACFIFCNFIPRVVTRTYNQPSNLTQELFKAHQEYDINQCITIFKKAARIYRNSPQDYFEFFNGRNAEGFSILHYAAATADQKSIERIICYLESFFGDNIEFISKSINAKTTSGCTALGLASIIGEPQALNILIQNAVQALAYNKAYVTQFLSMTHEKTGTTALHILSRASCSKGVYTIVDCASRILGKDSLEYNAVINAKDNLERTPLYFTHQLKLRHFLVENNAIATQKETKALQKALELGRQLISCVQDNDFVRFKNILQRISICYATNKNLLVSCLSALDNQGWTALHHTAAYKKREFLLYLLNKIHILMPGDFENIITILNAKDQEGKTALTLALLRKHFDISEGLIKRSLLMLTNKLYFYMYINSPEYYNTRTPLLCAAYNSTDSNNDDCDTTTPSLCAAYNSIDSKNNTDDTTIQMMIQALQDKFPIKSHAFFHFINATDSFNASALFYVNSQALRTLLISKGALQSPTEKQHNPRTHSID